MTGFNFMVLFEMFALALYMSDTPEAVDAWLNERWP